MESGTRPFCACAQAAAVFFFLTFKQTLYGAEKNVVLNKQ